MKLSENHLRGLTLGCGVVLVALGAAKGIFGLDLGEKAERWITNVLFVGAALAFIQLFKLRRQARRAAANPANGSPGSGEAPGSGSNRGPRTAPLNSP